MNEFQKVIELPTKPAETNEIGYVLGWGSMTYPADTYPVQLQRALMRVFPLSFCLYMFNFQIQDGQFCAHKQKGVGACVVSFLKYFINTFFHNIKFLFLSYF
jgi:hypothetical protein